MIASYCKLEYYSPLANVNFRTNVLTVTVKLPQGEYLSDPYIKEEPIVWDRSKSIIIYRIPVKKSLLTKEEAPLLKVKTKPGLKDTNSKVITEADVITEEVHCLQINDLKHIISEDRKELVSNIVGFMVYIEKPGEGNSKNDDDDDGDDGGRGTGVIWTNGTN